MIEIDHILFKNCSISYDNPAIDLENAKIHISKYIFSENLRLSWFKKLQAIFVTSITVLKHSANSY
jgi:hypothetical protein